MDIISKAKSLNLPSDWFAVVGSGVLEVHGIRKAKDLDIIVNEQAYQELKRRGWKRHWFFWRVLTCKALESAGNEAFSNFKCGKGYRVETEDILRKSKQIEGIKFLPIEDLLLIKKEFAKKRQKDADDVLLIEEYLKIKK